jgi:hypothetical protein
MSVKKLDAAAILRQLAELRARLPTPEGPRRVGPQPGSSTTRTKLPRSGDSMADFEAQAVIDALESMAEDVRAIIEEKQARLLAMALDVYYTAEELIRDPEHANLIPTVEAMRAAYKKDFGKPIPPRERKG